MANFPDNREKWSRQVPGRRQKKFTTRSAAEAFLSEAQREYIRNGGVSLATDRELHYDFMRATQLLADVVGGTLEKAVELLRMARSARELRGTGFVAPRDRTLQLDPRPFLLVQNQARERGITLAEMCNAMILMWAEHEAGRRVEQRMKTEELGGKLAARERARANAAKRAWAAGRRARLRAQEREARKLNEALKEI